MSVSRLLASSAFTLLSAVEIWDAAFRWREQGQLRDLTIDDTWARVAGWVTRVEPGSAEFWNS
jgi:ribonucleoside-diphosphate reductase alpha chain